jgi:hypothetical protein
MPGESPEAKISMVVKAVSSSAASWEKSDYLVNLNLGLRQDGAGFYSAMVNDLSWSEKKHDELAMIIRSVRMKTNTMKQDSSEKRYQVIEVSASRTHDRDQSREILR